MFDVAIDVYLAKFLAPKINLLKGKKHAKSKSRVKNKKSVLRIFYEFKTPHLNFDLTLIRTNTFIQVKFI